ncbi:MAG: nucleoside triphosphate pyrophosphohydrolase family protein [Alphaproteobacteria bacterium]|nr:nucleoside triphosphate pyrophosphohydrolase family protein [Alphaproteobacteria bacterium]
MAKTTLEQVTEFHETYGLSVHPAPDLSCETTKALRVNLLQEELNELKEALANNDVLETLDALIDLQYVLDGAFLSFGLQHVKESAFAEVHRSNMSKLGEDGQPIRRPEDGKVMKGPNYTPPDLTPFIKTNKKAA